MNQFPNYNKYFFFNFFFNLIFPHKHTLKDQRLAPSMVVLLNRATNTVSLTASLQSTIEDLQFHPTKIIRIKKPKKID